MEMMVKNEMNYRETMDDETMDDETMDDGYDAVVRIVKTREQRWLEKAMSTNIFHIIKRQKRLRQEANIKKKQREKEATILREQMIERDLIEEKLDMENARLLEEYDVKVGSERRSTISLTTQNKVQPSCLTCQVCLTMNAINCCTICKRMICVRDTVYRNKIPFCTACYYNPKNQPNIQAIINKTQMTCLKKLAKILIWLMSFEWLSKNKKK